MIQVDNKHATTYIDIFHPQRYYIFTELMFFCHFRKRLRFTATSVIPVVRLQCSDTQSNENWQIVSKYCQRNNKTIITLTMHILKANIEI